MTEQFANLAQSTLTAPISASQTTITVANASTFPLLGVFRIVVQSFDSVTGIATSAPEIMKVTGVAGNSFTVQRAAESSAIYPARAFSAGAQVTHILTAAVMQALSTGSGVTSLNSETGAINLVAGTNITITPAGQNITIDASGSGVTSFTSPNSTLTVSGTTSLIADINLSNANTWTSLQTHNISDSATNTVTNAIVLTHDTSGTPAASFGTGLLFQGQDTTTADQNMAAINAVWTTASHASRASALQFQTLTGAGSLTTQMTIREDGTVGIGTTSPGDTLQVTAANAPGVTIASSTNTQSLAGRAAFSIGRGAASTLTGWQFLKDQTDNFSFRSLAAGAATVRMTLSAIGQLGVNTATFGTQSKLTVNPNTTSDNSAIAQFNTVNTTDKGLVVQGVASQSGNLLEIQNSSGTVNAAITPAGVINSAALTASQAVFTDSSKNLVSNAITGTGNVAMTNNTILVAPALGTPASGVLTNCTGTASGLTAGAVTNATFTTALTVNTGTLTLTANAANTSVLTVGAGAVSISGSNTGDQTITLTGGVTGSGTGSFAATVVTNANLTGPITSVGNATSIASQTGTGTTFVMSAAPTLTGAAVAAKLTANVVIDANNAITASGNAATVPVTSKLNTVTNNSAATLTVTMTTASAVDGQMAIVRILDFSAAAQTITWVNTENSTVSAPTTSNGSTTLFLTVGFIFNGGTSKWRTIASA